MLVVNVKKHFSKQSNAEFFLDVSFTVANEFTVLTGASGAGKTTILRMIAGILSPDSGVIRLNSEIFFDSVKKINLSIQKRGVGFVFQDYALFPHLTAVENIAFGIKSNDKKFRMDKAREMLSLFRVEHTRQRIPREMSGGEQQRVALARALASEPRIALFDEPLSAVDVETRAKLLDEIETVQSRLKIPFIYVTHNKTEAERFGTKRLILRNGRIDTI